MPAPRLGPEPCSALGAHKPTSICAQGCWDTHQRVTAPKSSAGNSPESVAAEAQHSEQDETPVPRLHKQQRQHSPQSKSDRQERQAGKGAEPLLHTQEFRADSGFQTLDFSLAHCLPAGTHHHPANSTKTHTNGGSDQHQQLPLMFDVVR